jgi:hypothetical protein
VKKVSRAENPSARAMARENSARTHHYPIGIQYLYVSQSWSLRKGFRFLFQIFIMAVIQRILTCSPDDGHFLPSGKVLPFSQAKATVRDPMARNKLMLNILMIYLTLHNARLTVTVLNSWFLCPFYLLFLSFLRLIKCILSSDESDQWSSHRNQFNSRHN